MKRPPLAGAEPLLSPAEVAEMFRVDAKTVARWARSGRITSIRTLGGHRRYREAEILEIIEGRTQERTALSTGSPLGRRAEE
jgi:excisionase family DNA binding protein